MRLPGGLPEVPCAKCERRVPGLPWGELCPECRAERIRQAVIDTIVRDNVRTRDLGGTASTEEFGRAVARRVA